MQTLADQKSALRRAARDTRRLAHDTGAGAAPALRDAFLHAGLAGRPGAELPVVSGYCPIRTEIDPAPLMTALHEAGHRLCVPVIEGPGLALRFREWHPGCALVAGPFGAAVPAAGDWLEPGLLLAPLLAFDTRGYRLGYGGGFYDRTLEMLRARRPTLAVGLAYRAQEVGRVPAGPTDQRLDAIVTETGVLSPAPETAR